METQNLTLKKMALSVTITLIAAYLCYELVAATAITPETGFIAIICTIFITSMKILLSGNDCCTDATTWIVLFLTIAFSGVILGGLLGLFICTASFLPIIIIITKFIKWSFKYIVIIYDLTIKAFKWLYKQGRNGTIWIKEHYKN